MYKVKFEVTLMLGDLPLDLDGVISAEHVLAAQLEEAIRAGYMLNANRGEYIVKTIVKGID